MRLPIQYALLYPERKSNSIPPWSPLDTPHLTFEPVDHKTFFGVQLAREAAAKGGTMPCAFNAANEAATGAFLQGKCSFLGITDVVQRVMQNHVPATPTLENLLAVDVWATEEARKHLG
jgi:1-deoxy-D-xylulose-5-phosphate reductoisomerase